MTERESPEPPETAEPLESPPRTAWHPMLVALIERFLPTGYRLIAEFLLSRLSQRADIVVVRLEGEPGPVEQIHSILDYLAAHTIIEYKGPTDDLAGEDVLVLLGYAYQYMRRAKLEDPGDLCLMVVAGRITKSFLAQAKRSGMELAEAQPGIWRGRFAGFVVHGVETGKAAGRGPSEHLLYTFSRMFLQDPAGVGPLDEEEAQVYAWLYQQAEQYRRERGPMAVKDSETFEQSMMKMFTSLYERHPEFLDQILAKCPTEKRGGRVTPSSAWPGWRPKSCSACSPPRSGSGSSSSCIRLAPSSSPAFTSRGAAQRRGVPPRPPPVLSKW